MPSEKPPIKKDKKSKHKSVADAPTSSLVSPATEIDSPNLPSSSKSSKKWKRDITDTETIETQVQLLVKEKLEGMDEKKCEKKTKKEGSLKQGSSTPLPLEPVNKTTKPKASTNYTSQVKPTKPVSKSISTPREPGTLSKQAVKSDRPLKKSKKIKVKEPSPSPNPATVSDEEVSDGEADAVSGDDDENVHLHGFSTDDDDSSDEEGAMDTEPPTLDISKLPTIAKDDASVKRKLDKAKRQPTEERGILFLGRLPHGFYEDQLKAYFSQFGNVTRLRLSRNKKTGRSKHYGFLEFDLLSVAQIVADTMDNYLLMGHILRCKVIPKDEVHPELWVGANRKWRAVPMDRLTRVEHNKPRTEEEQARAAKRLLRRQNERKRKLAEAGIEYDFEAVGYKKAKDREA